MHPRRILGVAGACAFAIVQALGPVRPRAPLGPLNVGNSSIPFGSGSGSISIPSTVGSSTSSSVYSGLTSTTTPGSPHVPPGGPFSAGNSSIPLGSGGPPGTSVLPVPGSTNAQGDIVTPTTSPLSTTTLSSGQSSETTPSTATLSSGQSSETIPSTDTLSSGQSSETIPSTDTLSSGQSSETTPSTVTTSSVPPTTSALSTTLSSGQSTETIPSTTATSSSGGVPFVVPISTVTASFSIDLPSATSSGGFVATNPNNPQETVAFGSTEIPPEDRQGLPDVTDAAPLLLLLLGFANPGLLFGSNLLIYPLVAAGTVVPWLLPSMFPSPSQLSGGDGTPTNTENPTSSTSSASSSSSSSSSSSTSADSAPTPWVLFTRSGTRQFDFEDLIDSIGNPSDGKTISFPYMDYQIYSAKFSNEVAKNISSNPIVVSVDENSGAAPDDQGTINPVRRRRAIRNEVQRRQQYRRATTSTTATTTTTTPAAKLDRRATSTSLAFEPTFSSGPGEEPAENLVQQIGSPENLKMVSDFSRGKGPREYTFDDSLGEGVFIYILDTGVNRGHKEFSRHGVQVLGTRLSPTDSNGHGTRMADVAAGAWAGVAKKAKIVSVKINNSGRLEDETTKFDVVDAWSKIINDVITQNRQGKAVINFSASFDSVAMWAKGEFETKQEEDTHFENTIFKELLQDSFANGIVVVCAAGNAGEQGQDVSNRVPAGLARVAESTQLIVVGSVGASGTVSSFTNKDSRGLITVYANGEDVIAASHENNDGWTFGQGTSEATAMTSGLVAYFLGKPGVGDALRANGNANVARNAKNKLLEQSYSYVEGGPVILNNGELDFLLNAACAFARRRVRRGAGGLAERAENPDLTTTAFDGGQCSRTSASIPATTTTPESPTIVTPPSLPEGERISPVLIN